MKWKASSFLAVVVFLNIFIRVSGHRAKRGVINGIISEFNEFPFMAALGWDVKNDNRMEYLCGGVLIARNFVLTAAHCVLYEGRPPDVIQIGGNNLKGTDNEKHKVETYHFHPGYNRSHAYDDIAIIQLKTNSKKPIVSLWTDPNFQTACVIAIGYGTTQYAGSRSSILQKVKLAVVEPIECEPFFKGERKFREGIRDSLICAGDSQGKRDTCQDDSGGPLLIRKKYAAGIISSGQACAGYPPAVYTRISTYIEWIAGILNKKGLMRVDKILSVENNVESINEKL